MRVKVFRNALISNTPFVSANVLEVFSHSPKIENVSSLQKLRFQSDPIRATGSKYFLAACQGEQKGSSEGVGA